MLTVLGHRGLVPLRAAQHGAVVSRTGDGTLVGTKPGSFGDDDALAELHDLLRHVRAADPSTTDTTASSVYTLEQP
ncbi:hypothetical protein [Arthrobacter sp. RIT-PI-e]|uniref:hypothetical protein n=1 Tax=Arthrobacter sp. RIT-PI-e TaxID=1681197 RepID=UPI000AE4E41B|nr:hypothetical protein [Arthrobacter sp. RIT-PI-e]